MKLLIFIFGLILSFQVHAQVPFSYTGRLLTSDGTTAAAGNHAFWVKVKTDSTCTVFRRVYSAIPVDTDGKFEIPIMNTSTTGGGYTDFGANLQDILQSTGSPSLDCDNNNDGTTDATALRSTARTLEIEIFDTTSSAWEVIDVQAIRAAFEAVNAQRLGGRITGTSAGNIPVLDATGLIPQALLPAITVSQLPDFGAIIGTGTIDIADGGTGATTAAGALNNLLPPQALWAGAVLKTDGTTASWGTIANSAAVTRVEAGTGLNGGVITSTGTISLANTAVAAGVYGSSYMAPTFEVDAQGRLVAASTVAIAINANQVTAGTMNSAQIGNIDGSAISNIAASSVTIGTLSNSVLGTTGVVAGSSGSSTFVPTLTVDMYGRVTALGSSAISFPASGIMAIGGDVSSVVTNGTAALTILTDAVTSAKILDDTITNADISATANIADTKLGTIATAGKVANSATTADSANVGGAIVARNAAGAFSATTIGLSTLNVAIINASGTIYADRIAAQNITGTLDVGNLSGVPTCAAGMALTSNGAVWSCVSVSTGGISAIEAGAGLTGGIITTNGTIALGTTGVGAGTYGSSSWLPNFIVDVYGRLINAGSTAIAIDASQVTSGTLSTVIFGTTGVVAGSSGSTTYAPTLTVDAQGRVTQLGSAAIAFPTNVSIQNLNGLSGTLQNFVMNSSGTIAAINSVGTDHSFSIPMALTPGAVGGLVSNADYLLMMNGTIPSSRIALGTTGIGSGLVGNANYIPQLGYDVYGRLTSVGSVAVASSTGTVQEIVAGTGLSGGTISTNGTISLGTSGVAAGSFGGASWIPNFVVDAFGRLTSAGSTSIAIDATQITSGTLNNAQRGTTGIGSGSVGSSNYIPQLAYDVYGRLTSVGSVAVASSGGTVQEVVAGTGLTGGTISSNGTISLGTSGVAAGIYGSGSWIPTFAVDVYGRLTNAGSVAVSVGGTGTVQEVVAGTGLTGGTISSNGTISLGTSGVAAGSYGGASWIPNFVTDIYGRVTGAGSTSIAIDATQITSGTLNNAQRGTTGVAAGTYGSNTWIPTFAVDAYGRLTTAGSLAIPASGTGTVQEVVAGTGLTGGTISTNGTISLGTSGVAAGTYGGTSWIPNFVVDAFGRLTSAGSTTINIAATQVGSGTFDTARMGTTGIAAGSYGGSTWVPNFTVDAQGRLTSAGSTTIAFPAISGLQSLNGLTAGTQNFAVNNLGTTSVFVSSGTLHTLSVPMANAGAGVAGGLISNADYLVLMNGTIPLSRGGTGLTPTVADANRIYGLTSAGTLSEYKTLSGTGAISIVHSSGSVSFDLTSLVTAGTVGSSTYIPVIQYDRYGRITSAGSVAVSSTATVSQVVAGAGLSGGTITTAGTISLGTTGVAAGTYGGASWIPNFAADIYGRLTSVGSTAISIDGSQVTGTLSTAQLGTTGVTAGNYGGSTWVANFNVDSRGRIVSAGSTAILFPAGSTGTVQLVATGAGLSGGTFNTAGTISLAPSGVTGGNYGGASWIPNFTVDTFGRLTSAASTAIAINTSQINSGTLSVARGGTGIDGSSAIAGSLLIGNGSGYSAGTLTAGTNVSILNQNGTITISSSSSGTVTGVVAGTGLISTPNGSISTFGTLSLGTTGVAAGTVGNASYIPMLGFDVYGRMISLGSTAIALPSGGTIAAINGTPAAPGITFASDRDTGLYYSNGTIGISTNGLQRMEVNENGNIGVGKESSNNYRLRVRRDVVAPSTDVIGVGSEVGLTTSGAASGTYMSGDFAVASSAANNLNGSLVGIRGSVSHTGAGNISDVSGLEGIVQVSNGAVNTVRGLKTGIYNYSGTPVIDNAYGITTEISRSTGVFNTGYGLYIGPVQATTSYAIFSEDASARSVFNGALTVGTTTISTGSMLEVDRGALRIKNQNELRMDELSGNGSNYAALRAPDLLGGNLLWTLPSTQGTPGQFLVLGTAGSMTWGTTASSFSHIVAGAGLNGGTIFSSGTISLGTTGIAAGTVGNASYIPQIAFDIYGRIVNMGSSAVSINSVSGTLGVANGGTGLNASTVGAGGLLIGNGSGFTLGTITGSNGINITNALGSIAIATNGSTNNTANTLVMRDAYGGFAAGTIAVSRLSAINGAGTVGIAASNSGAYTMILPGTIGSVNQVLSTDGTSQLSWKSLSSSIGVTSTNNLVLFSSGGTLGSNSGFSYDPVGSNLYLSGTVSIGTTAVSGGARFEAAGSIRAGNGGELQLAEQFANGTNSISIRSPSAFTQNYTMVLPGTIGVAGQYLTTDGVGTLSWGSPASPFIPGADTYLFYNSNGTLGSSSLMTFAGGTLNTSMLRSNNVSGLSFAIRGSTNGTVGIFAPANSFANYNLLLPPDAGVAGQALATTGNGSLAWANALISGSTIVAAKGTDALPSYTFTSDNDTGLSAPTAGNLGISTNGTLRMSVFADGKVGIGNAFTPVTDFEIFKTSTLGVTTRVLNQNLGATAFSAMYVDSGTRSSSLVTNSNGTTTLSTNSSGLNLTTSDAFGEVAMATGGTRYVTLRPGGKFILGTTGIDSGNATNRLEVGGGAIAALPTGIAANNGGEVRFYDLAGPEYVGFRAPDVVATSRIWQLPASDGGPNQVLSTSGSGTLMWANNGAGSALAQFSETLGSTGLNAPVFAARLMPNNGGAASIDMVVSPKGSGALLAHLPDGGTGGGNKRGPWAVDLQTLRSVNTMVASGTGAVVAGGLYNTASNTFTVVGGGNSNIASNYAASVTGGDGNTASGQNATILGGYHNTASNFISTVVGGWQNTASGRFSLAGGQNTNAPAYAQTTFGSYNKPIGGEDGNNWVLTDPLFVIGNSNALGAESNAMVILKKW